MTELERFADAVPSMQIIREFLDWCEEQKIELAQRTYSHYRLDPLIEGREQMLARYFDIDSVRLENERRALLENK